MSDSDFKLCSFLLTPERHGVGFVRRAQQITGAWSALVVLPMTHGARLLWRTWQASDDWSATWRSVAFVLQLECLGNFRSSKLGAKVVFGLAQESVNAMWFSRDNGEHVCCFRSLVAIAWRL